MKNLKHLYLSLAIISFIIQYYDIVSTQFTLSLRQIGILVLIQVIGFTMYAYYHVEDVEDPQRMIRKFHYFAFFIYLANLIYQLFLNPNLRILGQYSVNTEPMHTITLFINAYNAGTLPLSNIVLNLLGNIVLFMPLGYFIYVLWKPFRHFLPYILLLLVIISSVEIGQWYFNVGTGDIDDLLLNMIGVIILFIIMKTPPLKKYLQHIKE